MVKYTNAQVSEIKDSLFTDIVDGNEVFNQQSFDDWVIMTAVGINWGGIEALSKAGVNWEGLDALSSAGVNWDAIGAMTGAAINWGDWALLSNNRVSTL